jgi:hypothetical protein
MTGLELALAIALPIISTVLGAVLLYFLIKWGTKNGMKDFNKESALKVQPVKGNVRATETIPDHNNTLNINNSARKPNQVNLNETIHTQHKINNESPKNNPATIIQQNNQNNNSNTRE